MPKFTPAASVRAMGRMLHPGQEFSDSDPVVVAYPSLFIPTDPSAGSVEQATAAPGETRTVNRPAKKTAKKATKATKKRAT